MTTDLEQHLIAHLRRRADQASPRYDLDAVERGLPLVSLGGVEARRRRRPLLGVAGTAAAVALLVVAALIGAGSDGERAPVTPSGEVPAVDRAVIQEMIRAINTRDADAFLGAFAPTASFNPRGNFDGSSLGLLNQRLSVDDVELVRAWMVLMDAWGLEAEPVSCDRPDNRAGGATGSQLVHCTVATRWHTLSMEITEGWLFELRGGEITFWSSMEDQVLAGAEADDMAAFDLDPDERELALGFDGLVAWEAWLREHHPDDAARWLTPRPELKDDDCNADCREYRDMVAPGDPARVRELSRVIGETIDEGWSIEGHRFWPVGLVPYDPAFVDEIEASIRDYLEET